MSGGVMKIYRSREWVLRNYIKYLDTATKEFLTVNQDVYAVEHYDSENDVPLLLEFFRDAKKVWEFSFGEGTGRKP